MFVLKGVYCTAAFHIVPVTLIKSCVRKHLLNAVILCKSCTHSSRCPGPLAKNAAAPERRLPNADVAHLRQHVSSCSSHLRATIAEHATCPLLLRQGVQQVGFSLKQLSEAKPIISFLISHQAESIKGHENGTATFPIPVFHVHYRAQYTYKHKIC